MSQEEASAKTKVLADNGVTIVAPSNALKDGLGKIGAELLRDWQTSASPEAKAIMANFGN